MTVCPQCGYHLRLVGLSDRLLEVLGLMARGLGNRDIATSLGINLRTVEAHVQSIFTHLDLPPDETGRRVMATQIYAEERQRII